MCIGSRQTDNVRNQYGKRSNSDHRTPVALNIRVFSSRLACRARKAASVRSLSLLKTNAEPCRKYVSRRKVSVNGETYQECRKHVLYRNHRASQNSTCRYVSDVYNLRHPSLSALPANRKRHWTTRHRLSADQRSRLHALADLVVTEH